MAGTGRYDQTDKPTSPEGVMAWFIQTVLAENIAASEHERLYAAWVYELRNYAALTFRIQWVHPERVRGR